MKLVTTLNKFHIFVLISNFETLDMYGFVTIIRYYLKVRVTGIRVKC